MERENILRHAGYKVQGPQNVNAPKEAHHAYSVAQKAREAAQKAIEAHPEHADFVKRSKEHNRLIRGGNYGE
jgi:hypothetical protein